MYVIHIAVATICMDIQLEKNLTVPTEMTLTLDKRFRDVGVIKIRCSRLKERPELVRVKGANWRLFLTSNEQ